MLVKFGILDIITVAFQQFRISILPDASHQVSVQSDMVLEMLFEEFQDGILERDFSNFEFPCCSDASYQILAREMSFEEFQDCHHFA